jgi:hypothetical protein
VQVAPNPRRKKQASPGEADLKRVQLAPSRRKNSLEVAAEAVVNLVQVAPKSRKNKNQGKAAEAAQSHSAVCTYSGFRSKRLSRSTNQERRYDESLRVMTIHPLSGSDLSKSTA